ncbi:MAG: DedA family protein [Candidatus Paceibacterota bacterium]|jgi:membrane protein DedA with SNARE-associated domain
MDALVIVLPGFLSFLAAYKYLLIFLGVFFEGPIIMMAGGFLVRTGALPLLLVYGVLMAGDLSADICWYWLGRWGGERIIRTFGNLLGTTVELFENIEKLFKRHDVKILFISKLTTGFGFAVVTLIAAGAAKVPFRRYLITNGIGEFVWTGFLMGVGYVFGNAYVGIADATTRITTLIVAIVFLILLVWIGGRMVRKLIGGRMLDNNVE